MTQNELNRAVACATGESVSEISSRGFSPLPDDPYDCGVDTIDWDSLEQSRSVAVPQSLPCATVTDGAAITCLFRDTRRTV